MAINLSKGQKIDLRKAASSLRHLEIGLGWNPNPNNGADFDPDASAFLLGANGKCANENDFIFYNNLTSIDGSVQHTGDDRTGGTSEIGPDEIIKVNLPEVSGNYSQIDFVVTIHDAVARKQNFGQMTGIFMNVVDKDTGEEIIRYDMAEDFSLETSVIFGSVIRENCTWIFKAVGQGFEKDLADLVRQYGLDS
ncbi:TerD family protein [Lactococcus lactis]|uniref:TerD family protein n=1 Tax=Lactococcus lactis TaxID=1358 RepID=UPI0026588DAE|nr:TerD family protein [Lactococcus lactis]WKF72449.1 TerD family protein [Lactococcus lactis]